MYVVLTGRRLLLFYLEKGTSHTDMHHVQLHLLSTTKYAYRRPSSLRTNTANRTIPSVVTVLLLNIDGAM